jgi:hypothetical protein
MPSLRKIPFTKPIPASAEIFHPQTTGVGFSMLPAKTRGSRSFCVHISLLRNTNAMLTPRSLRETNKRFIDEATHAALSLAVRHPGVAVALERLLLHVHQQSDLLHPCRKCGELSGNGRRPLVGGLLALALHHADWLRPVEVWKPTGTSAWPQFTSLSQHLFAKYPIPVFMTSAWFGLPLGEKLIEQEWYKQLGLGASVRSLKFRLSLPRPTSPTTPYRTYAEMSNEAAPQTDEM